MAAATTPPYELRSHRLVLRCYTPDDAELLKDAVDTSLDHLRPFMPWAEHEPTTIAEKVTLLRAFRGKFDLDQDYVYGFFNRDETKIVGGGGLHRRAGDNALEIGYWVRADSVRRGIVTEAITMLTRAAFDGACVERVDIGVQVDNAASLGAPRKAGFVHEHLRRAHIDTGNPQAPRADAVMLSMTRDEYERSDISRFPMRALDVRGGEIPLSDS